MSNTLGITGQATLNAAQAIANSVTAPIGAIARNIGQRTEADVGVALGNIVAANMTTTTSRLQSLFFPSEIITTEYKFKIDLADYTRAGLFEVGKLNTFQTITLPLPQNLVDSHQVEYEDKPLIRTPENSIIDAAKAIAGLTTNELMVVLLKGPKFKRYEFTWKLAPKNANESIELTEIIRVLNKAMAPSMQNIGAIFKFPKIFQLSFAPNHQQLYRFKPAVLSSFTTNFAAGGIPAFYKQTDAPESVELKLFFIELEYWLSSDFDSATNPYAGRAQAGGATGAFVPGVVSQAIETGGSLVSSVTNFFSGQQ